MSAMRTDPLTADEIVRLTDDEALQELIGAHQEALACQDRVIVLLERALQEKTESERKGSRERDVRIVKEYWRGHFHGYLLGVAIVAAIVVAAKLIGG